MARARNVWAPFDSFKDLNAPLSSVTPRFISSIQIVVAGSVTIEIVRVPLAMVAWRGRWATATPQQRIKMQTDNFIATTFTPNDPQRASAFSVCCLLMMLRLDALRV
jgi:hypothetical protein